MRDGVTMKSHLPRVSEGDNDGQCQIASGTKGPGTTKYPVVGTIGGGGGGLKVFATSTTGFILRDYYAVSGISVNRSPRH